MFFLLLILSSLFTHSVKCDSTFKFGAALCKNGGQERFMDDVSNGYKFYFEKLNERHKKGFPLGGFDNSTTFNFTFNFIEQNNCGNKTTHATKVTDLIKKDKIHFLGGSHADYANKEMKLAHKNNGLLNYQCCVEPDKYYERDYPSVFGITASNRELTKNFVRSLTLERISSMMIIYDDSNTLTRTTCETAEDYFAEGFVSRLEGMTYKFNASMDKDEFFAKMANDAKKNATEAIVACMNDTDGKRLVEELHKVKHPLKAFFLSSGPADKKWVNSFHPSYLSTDLYSGTQWHPNITYVDKFFGSAHHYAKLYRKRFHREPSQWAAAASAVALTLVDAIHVAFQSCDISKTTGSIEALLFDPNAIRCEDFSVKKGGEQKNGYRRILEALSDCNLDTFFGKVKFNYYQRNSGLETVTTQVLKLSDSDEGPGTVETVFPVGYGSSNNHFPAKNHYSKPCGPGYYIGPDPFDPCKPCLQGEFSNDGNVLHCDSCDIGNYTDNIASENCMTCPSGTTTEVKGSVKITDCVCMPNFYHPFQESGKECQKCLEGAKCPGKDKPYPLPGYWTNKAVPTRMYACDPPGHCLGGENVTCENRRDGRLCDKCQEGYFSAINRCYECIHDSTFFFIALCLVVAWYVISVIVSHSVPSLEMVLSFAQLANIIGDVRLSWTRNMDLMFGVSNFLDYDVNILEPNCTFNWGFRQNFFLQLWLPFVMLAMAACGYFASFLAHSAIEKRWMRLHGKLAGFLSYLIDVPENQIKLKEKQDKTLAAFLASIDITYVTICKYCLDVFKCTDIGGVSVISNAPDVMCDDSSNYKFLFVLASVGVIFYVVGYPAFICWKLYELSGESTFSDPIQLRRFGFIYEKFELSYYFTSAIITIRKLLFVVVLVYINSPAFQVGSLAVFITASLMLHVYTAPYVDTNLDVLFSFLLVALMMVAFGGLMFYSENLPERDGYILEWIIITSMLILLVIFVAIFLMEIHTNMSILFIKNEHRKYAKSERCGSEMSGSSSLDEKISFKLIDTFKPHLVALCLHKDPKMIEGWDKLTNMLKDYISDQSVTSYLSMDPVAKFWRKLVDRFPELVDFLAVTDQKKRESFNAFATELFRNYYLTNKIHRLPLIEVLNWRDYAPMAQWLAIASEREREFFVEFVSELFRIDGKRDDAEMLTIRSQSSGSEILHKRPQSGVLSNEKRRAMESLEYNSDPLRHSSSTEKLKRVSSWAAVFSRLRFRFSSGCSLSSSSSDDGEKNVNGNELTTSNPATVSSLQSSNPSQLPPSFKNQPGMATVKKSVSWKDT